MRDRREKYTLDVVVGNISVYENLYSPQMVAITNIFYNI